MGNTPLPTQPSPLNLQTQACLSIQLWNLFLPEAQGYFLGSPTAETLHFLSPLGSPLRMHVHRDAWENGILKAIYLRVALSCPFTRESP